VDFSLKGFKDKVSLQLFEWRLEIVRLVMKKPKKALGKRTREIADVSLSSPQHFLYKKVVLRSLSIKYIFSCFQEWPPNTGISRQVYGTIEIKCHFLWCRPLTNIQTSNSNKVTLGLCVGTDTW
jgi:hypothetical protein